MLLNALALIRFSHFNSFNKNVKLFGNQKKKRNILNIFLESFSRIKKRISNFFQIPKKNDFHPTLLCAVIWISVAAFTIIEIQISRKEYIA